MSRRTLVSWFAVASLATTALLTLPPAAALAAPGDLVLRKAPAAPATKSPRPVTGSFVGAGGVAAVGGPAPTPPSLAELARRRSAFPHEIFGKGFDPARSIASPLRRGRIDLFQSMRDRAARRSAWGTEAAPLSIASVPGEDTIRVVMIRVDFKEDRGGTASSGDGRFDLSPRDSINRPLDPTPHDRAF
ncbi:MAG: hypothetical protein ABI960_06075, partial [Candidatus Eisenbacteria bacterium]